jgi:predicted AlkP superfamily phosphohydrolase/phosphomutase
MMRTGTGAALLATLCLFAVLTGCGDGRPPRAPATQRTIVIGFDGMDPALTERWMADGSLPHFAALRERGHYQHLATTNPPQSPVAWASFATGTDPGEHGIFDFLRRKTGSYEPDFSIAELAAPEPTEFLGMKLSLGEPQLRNRRHGEPLWLAAEARGARATVLRVPVTYPPDPVHGMIAGMGVPDLLGTQGTYTLLATRPLPNAENGGRVLTAPIAEDGSVQAQLDGPADPWSSSNAPLRLPLHLAPSPNGAQLTLGTASVPLVVGQWSDWIRLRYSAGLLGSVKGMTRAYLTEGFPRPLLYLAPLQTDPADPALPISSPPAYATALQQRIGTYHTLGMPEETWALNQGHLGEQAWLDMVATTLHEGEAMLYDALERRDSELVVEVFVQTDRVSHMFWRGLDPAHPLHADSSELARAAIPNIYREADRVLGEVLRRLGPGDRLIVLSDHGFAAYRRSVHVNRWLVEQGFMTLRPGADPAAPLFAAVDWSKTRAYALGLNGIYLNRRGREPEGIVAAADVTALKAELRDGLVALRDPADQAAVVLEVSDAETIYSAAQRDTAPDLQIGYAPGYRASWQTSLGAVPAALVEDNRQFWSGDHCIAPQAVPGVLFTSFRPAAPVAGIADIAGLIAAPPAGAP